MLRRTKIIATLGPAVDDPSTLFAMLASGVDVVRVNFSHGLTQEHQRRIEAVRSCAEQLERPIGILVDLQGPKIRIACFKNGAIKLKKGDVFVLDAALPEQEGTETSVGIDYKNLPGEVSIGNVLLIDDGRMRLTVEAIEGPRIVCRVQVNGVISNHKGINVYGGGLSARSFTEKDKEDLRSAVRFNVDYIALSFVREASEIHEVRSLLKALGSDAGIIAKIERAEAVQALDAIIAASDGVMVARGDLAVEIGDAEVPAIQKTIIKHGRMANKPVIIATQMMESMIHSTVPTRAEVSDVANAVLDGSDAVMLSAETATGDHPDVVVKAMARICLSSEKHPRTWMASEHGKREFSRVDEAVAVAAMFTANHMKIKAIIALTESGATPLWMSRIRSGIPIYALSRHARTRGKVCLYRDVYPIVFDVTEVPEDSVNAEAVLTLQKRGLIKHGDLVILTRGDLMGVHGQSNVMKVLEVPYNIPHNDD